ITLGGAGGLPGSLRHCLGPTPLLGLPGTKATADGLTMQLSLRTTLRSPPSWCSITTVRSSTARTRTCLPLTIALKPPLTSWFKGGTMLASETSSAAILLIEWLPRARRRLCSRGKMKLPSSSFGSNEAYQNITRAPEAFRGPVWAGRRHATRPGCAPAAAAAGRLPDRGGRLPCSPGGEHAGGWGRPSIAAG